MWLQCVMTLHSRRLFTVCLCPLLVVSRQSGDFFGCVIAQFNKEITEVCQFVGHKEMISVISLNQPAQNNNSHFLFILVSSLPPFRARDMTSTT